MFQYLDRTVFLTGTTLLLLIFAPGCTKEINVFSYKPTDAENRQSREFLSQPQVNIAQKKNILLVYQNKNESPETSRFFRDGRTFYISKFGNYAHMQNRLDTLEEKSQGLIPLFEQANSEEMDFLAIYRAELFEYGDRAGHMYYETGITADFYQVSSRKLIGVNKLILKSSQKDLAEKEIRKFAANYFPVRGFVTETRGEGEVARVAAGGSSGFKKGDRILFRNAILKQNRATNNNVMTVSTSVDYSDEVIGYGEIELLGDDFSWVKIESKYRQAVKAGTVGFISPE